MIVRRLDAELLLIRQPDHAALARRIMEQWADLATAERRTSILRATGEHDYGWGEHDAAPIIDAATGRICDFINLPLPLRQGVWPRSAAQLSSDPWAAALVAHHAIFVYDRFRRDSAWQNFFAEMEGLRAAMLREARDATFDDLQRDYVFVRLGDLASLTFCSGWTDAQRFADYTIALSASRLLIDPDPFNGHEMILEVPARRLPDRTFHSDSAAAQAFAAASTITLSGTAKGANVA
jgi:hypothetical protein